MEITVYVEKEVEVDVNAELVIKAIERKWTFLLY